MSEEVEHLSYRRLISFVVIVSMLAITIFPCKANATSWAYPFVVWDDYIYVISDENVENIDKEIGEVTKYSDMEQYEGNFSNVYPQGTKYYSIVGINTDHAMAVQVGDDQYIKAFREGPYTYKKSYTQYIFKGLGILAFLFVALIIYAQTRKKL